MQMGDKFLTTALNSANSQVSSRDLWVSTTSGPAYKRLTPVISGAAAPHLRHPPVILVVMATTTSAPSLGSGQNTAETNPGFLSAPADGRTPFSFGSVSTLADNDPAWDGVGIDADLLRGLADDCGTDAPTLASPQARPAPLQERRNTLESDAPSEPVAPVPATKKKKRKSEVEILRGQQVTAVAKYKARYKDADIQAVLTKFVDPTFTGSLRELAKRTKDNTKGRGKVPLSTLQRALKKIMAQAKKDSVVQVIDLAQEYVPEAAGHFSSFKALGFVRFLAGMIGWRAGLKEPMSEEEAGEVAATLYDCTTEDMPASWVKNGKAPPKHWWCWFWAQPETSHIKKAKMNSLSEARAAASTPAVIKDWFGRTASDMEPTTFVKHLIKNQPFVRNMLAITLTVAATALTPSTVLANAAGAMLIDKLLHDPARNACFDEKGLVLSGSDSQKLLYVRGMRAFARMQEDGTWCSICPLAFWDGFWKTAIIVEGAETTRVHRDTRRNLWGTKQEETFLHFTKCGYNNTETMLLIISWWCSIATIKARLPFVLWLDNASMHVAADVTRACRQAGIILRFFRAHSTHWSCMLDNGIFCKWNKIFNAALNILKIKYRSEKNANGIQIRGPKSRLPFEQTCIALRLACEGCLSKENMRIAVSTTTHLFTEAEDGSQRITLSSQYAERKMSGKVAGITDKTSTQTRRNMKHSVNNDKAIEAFKNAPWILPLLDNAHKCTRCSAVMCDDHVIRCVDCIQKKKRKNQLLYAGGWSVEEEEENEVFAQRDVDAAAAAGTEQAKGEAAKQLAVMMADNSTSDQQKHDDLAEGLKAMGRSQWHQATCKRGPNLKCACIFGKAREERNRLQEKLKAERTAKKAEAKRKRVENKEQEDAKAIKRLKKVMGDISSGAIVGEQASDAAVLKALTAYAKLGFHGAGAAAAYDETQS